ncbi:MAG: hypothetical protein ACI8WB_003065 [Phenylobacterium sp.]|jgi:hypothetical protein
MNAFTFSLVLGGVDINTPELEDKLFEAGCDDGLICFYGHTVYIDFDREANDFKSAIMSAIKAIEQADLNAKVVSVDAGDYVGLSDVSKLTDISKQSIALLKDGKRGPGAFPNPVLRLDGRQPLWRWGEVADWLAANHKIAPELAENARIVECFNMALEMRKPEKRHKVTALTQILEDLEQ